MAKNNKDLVKKDDFGLFDDNTMMMFMTVMMMAVMIQFIGPMTQQLQTQTQILQAQSYHGTEDPRTVRATSYLTWINLVYDYPFTPWISAYFINDGPSAVEIGINYPDDRFLMNPGETITVNRTGALDEKINIIFFKCTPGLSATVRVTGSL